MQARQRREGARNRLLDAGIEGFAGGMTTQKYALMTDTSRATAFRELDQLLELAILERVGQGRSARYELVVAHLS